MGLIELMRPGDVRRAGSGRKRGNQTPLVARRPEHSGYVEHSASQHILNVALGEGRIPLSIIRDQCSEELDILVYSLVRKDQKIKID